MQERKRQVLVFSSRRRQDEASWYMRTFIPDNFRVLLLYLTVLRPEPNAMQCSLMTTLPVLVPSKHRHKSITVALP